MVKCYDICGKLKIRSDVKLRVPSYFGVNNVSEPDLTVELTSKEFSKDLELTAPPYMSSGRGIVVHRYKTFRPCEISLQNLEGKTRITISPLYYKRVKNAKRVIRYVIDIKLLQKGILKTHGSCFEYNGKGVLVAGWDASGKSTIATHFVDKGASFLSGDMTYLGKKFAYSHPKKIKMFRGHTRFQTRLNSIPYINRYLGTYEKIEPKNAIDKTKLDYVFISRYGDKMIRKISKKEAVSTLMLLSDYMLRKSFDEKDVVMAYSHYNKYDLAGLLKTRYEILDNILEGVECYEFFSRSTSDSISMVSGVIEKR